MLKILVVDDNSNKISKMMKVITSVNEISSDDVDICLDAESAKKKLLENRYDLLVLDISLPEKIGAPASTFDDGGIRLLNELTESIRLIQPFHIIGITAYKKLIQLYSESFHEKMWFVIHYDDSGEQWRNQLKNKLKYLVHSKRTLKDSDKGNYDYDVGIITALHGPELKHVLKLKGNWEAFKNPIDPTVYYEGSFRDADKTLKVVACAQSQMGMSAASVLSMKIINNYRPKYLVMTGIAAAVSGLGGFGDILVAESSWDYGNGKVQSDDKGMTRFLPDPKSIPLECTLKGLMQAAQLERKYLDDIKNLWSGPKPKTSLEMHIGPLASGAAVIEDDKIVVEIKGHSRKLLGVDMETFGVFYAAQNSKKPSPIALSIKSISDFADSDKNDEFQDYAAFTSAQYLYRFALDNW